jgi:sulfite exporter TauE/SafE
MGNPAESKAGYSGYLRFGAAALALAALFLLLSRIDLIPNGISFGENIGYGIVFLIGLLASVSTCIAVTGGLFMTLASKYDEQASHLSPASRFVTYLSFNVGRIISYTSFGGLIGLLGSALMLSSAAYGAVTVAVSLFMLIIGVQMLGLMPGVKNLRLQMPSALKRWNETLLQRNSRSAAFTLGALTFFLPCGFTQALQLYVLAKADPIAGALTMFVFSLGTLPVLMGLSLATSFTAGNLKRYFFRFAGAAVIVLSLSSIHQGLLLLNLWPSRPAVTQQAALEQSRLGAVILRDGKQIANMKIVGLEYLPNRFAVVEGVPVEWHIDATEAEGCGRVIVVPKLRISRLLSAKEPTVIQFTPAETGEISFNCGMRMMTPDSKFLVTRRAS